MSIHNYTNTLPRAWLSVALLVLVGAVTGCVSGPAYAPAPQPAPGKALLYIYRQGGFRPGAAGSHHVLLNHKRITILRHGGYFPCTIEPGPVTLGLDLRATPLLIIEGLVEGETSWVKFDAEPGKVYYVKFVLGGLSRPAHLESVDPAVGAREIRDCKLLKPESP